MDRKEKAHPPTGKSVGLRVKTLMAQIIGSPGRYAQGDGIAIDLAEYVSQFAKRAAVLVGANVKPKIKPFITKSFADTLTEAKADIVDFRGECSRSEVERIVKIARKESDGVIVGVGGGKTIDTAKAVAHEANLPVIVMPTAASSDAPCSALSVLYTDDHIFDSYLHLEKNPDVVLVDSRIIAGAPPRLLAAGMGDALATYFEARAVAASDSLNCLGGHVTQTALGIARQCYDTLLADGVKALLAAGAGVVTPALEHIIEANTYMSGIGFESGGLAAAHAIHNGLTILPQTHALLHGEKVAFGLLAMLVMEDAPTAEFNEVAEFCLQVGLPVTFEDMGMEDVTRDELLAVGGRAAAMDDTAHNMPFHVTALSICDALVTADALGRDLIGADLDGCCDHEHCGHEH